eukprot:Phypoly_transcript_10034.p1 GENE.Phypoly_transcript_10034~~Phypoly_transcript_10034.p1  ORF type:complete len:210 (+),score=55.42 Phypoly_transcript_10034:643-1272(+)
MHTSTFPQIQTQHQQQIAHQQQQMAHQQQQLAHHQQQLAHLQLAHHQQQLAHHHHMQQIQHNPMLSHQAIMQQAMAQFNEVAMMHNAMASAFNNMFGMQMQFPPIEHHSTARYHQQSGLNSYEELLHLDESVKKRGVSGSDLSKLKRVRYNSKDKCKQCGICQENFVVGTKLIALPCSHLYCEEEILKWFDQNKTCPTCRHVIENVGVY